MEDWGISVQVQLKDKLNNTFWRFQSGSIIVVVCKSPEQRTMLIEVMAGHIGGENECTIGDINARQDVELYKREVAYIDPKIVESNLSVRDYLNFYAMICDKYSQKKEEELAQLLDAVGKKGILESRIEELYEPEKIIVSGLVAYIKGAKLILANNLFKPLDNNSKNCILKFIQETFSAKLSVCVLIEEEWNENIEMIRVIGYNN